LKKLLVSILAIFYIASSTGATVHMHYCMGKLVNLELNGDGADKCNKCAETEENSSCSKDCCEAAQKTVKLQHDQKAAETLLASFSAAQVHQPSLYFSFNDNSSLVTFSGNDALSHAPPLRGKTSLTILYRHFRI